MQPDPVKTIGSSTQLSFLRITHHLGRDKQKRFSSEPHHR